MKKEFIDKQIKLYWVENVDLEYLRTNKDNLYRGLIFELNKLKEEWVDEYDSFNTKKIIIVEEDHYPY